MSLLNIIGVYTLKDLKDYRLRTNEMLVHAAKENKEIAKSLKAEVDRLRAKIYDLEKSLDIKQRTKVVYKARR